jgi:hypothetical protein
MSDIKPLPIEVERNIHESVYNFFIYGFQPGSYTTYMLMHDFERATRSAHPHLVRGHPHVPSHDGTPHDCMVHVFKDLPDFLVKENFHSWKGYLNISEAEQQEIKAPYTNKKLREYQTYRILNGYSEIETFYKWIKQADLIITNNRTNYIV